MKIQENDNCFAVNGTRLWNALPSWITIDSGSSFKFKITNYVFTLLQDEPFLTGYASDMDQWTGPAEPDPARP